jgi:NTE family protein
MDICIAIHDSLLEQVTFISTVSGGTLITGLIYAINGYRWPTSNEFLDVCLPKARYYLTQTDLQREVTLRSFVQPWYLLQGRAKLVSKGMQNLWNISGNIGDIPLEPRWILNATAYESGRNWRFIPQRRMGDYALNYVKNPTILLTDAMAASAAYPGLIGPLILNTDAYEWFRYEGIDEVPTKPAFRKIHLWDGGVYDNLGIEPLFKTYENAFREEFNFTIICDASKSLDLTPCPPRLTQRAFRLVGIAMDQVRGLRSRSIVRYFDSNKNSGVYLKMGNTAHKICSAAKMNTQQINSLCQGTLESPHVESAVEFPTTLRKLQNEEFMLIYRHGWEVANCTLHARCPELFSYSQQMPCI